MKIDISLGRGCICRIEDRREGEATQPRGNQRRGSSLAASDQKAAPAKVNRIIRLRRLSQTRDLRIFRWNRNLTAPPQPVKVELEMLSWRDRPHIQLGQTRFRCRSIAKKGAHL